MIYVRIFWDNKAIQGFSVSGHSGYLPSGSDIVCSAVSALAQTAVLALKDVADIEPDWTRKDGLLDCRLPADLDVKSRDAAQLILKTVITGIENIAHHYPRHVTVTNKEV